MINAAGKQALKNSGPPVTNCFADRPDSARKCRFGVQSGVVRAGDALARASENRHFGAGPRRRKPNANVIAPQSVSSRAPCLSLLAGSRGRGRRLIRGFGGVIVDEVPWDASPAQEVSS